MSSVVRKSPRIIARVGDLSVCRAMDNFISLKTSPASLANFPLNYSNTFAQQSSRKRKSSGKLSGMTCFELSQKKHFELCVY